MTSAKETVDKAESALTRILEELDQRQISYDFDVLSKPFTSAATADEAVLWVDEWLNEDNLLSKEELEILGYLRKSEPIKSFDSQQIVQPAGNACKLDLQAATAALKASTEMIQSQTSRLKNQLQDLDRLCESMIERTGNLKQKAETREIERHRETRTLSHASDELAAGLQKVLGSYNRAEDQKVYEHEIVETLLQRLADEDDRALEEIQRKLNRLRTESAVDVAEEEQRVRKLGERLIFHKTLAIQNRLDRIYLEAVLNDLSSKTDHSDPSKSRKRVTTKDVKALETELNGLYTEIGSVAEISTTQEHMEPALHTISQAGARKYESDANQLNWVLARLTYLLQRRSIASGRIATFHAHHAARRDICSSIEQEIIPSPSTIKSPPPPTSPVIPRSPIKRRPSRTHSRSSSYSEKDVEPETALLRNLGIPASTNQANGDIDSDSLVAAAHDRNTKALTALQTLEHDIERLIGGHLGDAEGAWAEVQQVLQSDWKKSKYLKFVNNELEDGIEDLEIMVEDIGARVSEIDMSLLKSRDKAKKTFVGRWAR